MQCQHIALTISRHEVSHYSLQRPYFLQIILCFFYLFLSACLLHFPLFYLSLSFIFLAFLKFLLIIICHFHLCEALKVNLSSLCVDEICFYQASLQEDIVETQQTYCTVSKRRDLQHFSLIFLVGAVGYQRIQRPLPQMTVFIFLPHLCSQFDLNSRCSVSPATFLPVYNLLFSLIINRHSCQMPGLLAFGGPVASCKDFHSVLAVVQVSESFPSLLLVRSSLWSCRYHPLLFYFY